MYLDNFVVQTSVNFLSEDIKLLIHPKRRSKTSVSYSPFAFYKPSVFSHKVHHVSSLYPCMSLALLSAAVVNQHTVQFIQQLITIF